MNRLPLIGSPPVNPKQTFATTTPSSEDQPRERGNVAAGIISNATKTLEQGELPISLQYLVPQKGCGGVTAVEVMELWVWVWV
jgi:hypothetical protein